MRSRWSHLLLALLLVGQLSLLAAQTPDRGGERSLLAGMTLRLLGPLARGITALGDTVGDVRGAMAGRARLAEENRLLRSEVLELRRDRLRVGALEREAEALARGLGFERRTGWRLTPAEVVYLDRESWLRTLIVYVGPGAARIDQAVVTELGVVGRVIATAGGYAKVQLVTDAAASAGAVVERVHRQAIVHGGSDGKMTLEFVPRQVDVVPGDVVTTAGIDGVYPRGLPLGTVVSVEPGDELFHHIVVEPAADLARLDFVYLVEEASPPAELGARSPDGAR
ncbi:MAG: rod shape-determining protein MreC [Acidobacteria bacterium]|nr:rod shape-determining protein MreC [Acidobacteriota bacterium]